MLTQFAPVDVLRLDIEGHEFPICHEFDWHRGPRYVQIEIHHGDYANLRAATDMVNRIENFGYVCERFESTNSEKTVDAVFVKNGSSSVEVTA